MIAKKHYALRRAHLDTLNQIACLQQRMTPTQNFCRSFELRQVPARVCGRTKRHPRVVELWVPAWGRVSSSTGIRLNCFLKWSERPLSHNTSSQIVQHVSVSGPGVVLSEYTAQPVATAEHSQDIRRKQMRSNTRGDCKKPG